MTKKEKGKKQNTPVSGLPVADSTEKRNFAIQESKINRKKGN